MVSPSGIIDVVWHQHLIFTQAYQEFTSMIGKLIQHVPSTHNKQDFEKFRQAKIRTNKLYVEYFGEQPASIWNFSDMYEILALDKAKIKIRTFTLAGILLFAFLTIPAYYLLKPLYVSIHNPDFVLGFIVIAILIFTCLELFNRMYLTKLVNGFRDDSHLHSLKPLELVYLKTQKLSNVVNGIVNEFVQENKIKVHKDSSIEKSTIGKPGSVEEFQTLEVLGSLGRTFYPNLLKALVNKPIFSNVSNCMDALKKYFIKSRKFGILFYINFTTLALLFLIGIARFASGVLREKPVTQIFISMVILTIITIFYLDRLTKFVCTHTIPKLYVSVLLPKRKIDDSWQWRYFLLGTSALAISFIPIVNYIDKSKQIGGGCGTSCGTSCGSSSASSCSSCGGCGGD
jgi:hypothetical protein